MVSLRELLSGFVQQMGGTGPALLSSCRFPSRLAAWGRVYWFGLLAWVFGLGFRLGFSAWVLGLGSQPGFSAWVLSLGSWPGFLVWVPSLGCRSGLSVWVLGLGSRSGFLVWIPGVDSWCGFLFWRWPGFLFGIFWPASSSGLVGFFAFFRPRGCKSSAPLCTEALASSRSTSSG